MKVVNGKQYYTLEESASLAGVSIRTLRRWIADGRLSDFIFPFRAGSGELLYRLEEPDKGDEKNSRGEWMLKAGGGGANAGGGVS